MPGLWTNLSNIILMKPKDSKIIMSNLKQKKNKKLQDCKGSTIALTDFTSKKYLRKKSKVLC